MPLPAPCNHEFDLAVARRKLCLHPVGKVLQRLDSSCPIGLAVPIDLPYFCTVEQPLAPILPYELFDSVRVIEGLLGIVIY
jgi:hypothetical protein